MSDVVINGSIYRKLPGNRVNVRTANPRGNIGDAGYIRQFNSGKEADAFVKAVQEKADSKNVKQEFIVNIQESLTSSKLSGNINESKYNITNNGDWFKNRTLTGQINGKKLNLELEENLIKPDSIKGTLGDDIVDLKLSKNLFSGLTISGKFKDKDVSINLKNTLFSHTLKSDNIDMEIKNKSLLGNDLKLTGKYNEDTDLFPILASIVYHQNKKEKAVAAITAMNMQAHDMQMQQMQQIPQVI